MKVQWKYFNDIMKKTHKSEGLSSTSAAMAGRRRACTSSLLVGSHSSSWYPWAEARESSARQSSEKTPQLPAILKIWINFLNKRTTEQFHSQKFHSKKKKKNIKKRHTNKTNAFGWKTKNILQLLGKSFSPQYIPNEKSVASLLVASHTSPHTAHTTTCTRLSPKEIHLQN